MVGSIAAPVGAPESKLNVRLLAGRSASLAVAVKLSSTPSSTVWLPIGSSTGATLSSPTVMVIVSESSSAGVPSSVTRTVTSNVPGPSASLGVQLNAPVVGSIAAPVGAPESKLNVRLLAGTSASLAVAVKLSSTPSSTV